MATRDIDQIAGSVAERTVLTGTERFYLGAPTATPGVSSDGWCTADDLANFAKVRVPRTLASNVTAYTVVDADVYTGIDTSATTTVTITIPSTLTVYGSIVVRKGGTGNVVLAAGAGVTLDKPGGRSSVVTQYQTMAALAWGSLTHYTLSGAEA